MARLRRHPASGEQGFSLVELLVAMGVLGILAAIAIPTIVDQRGKAQDAVTRQDAQRLAKRVVGYFLEYSTPPTVQITGGRFAVGTDDVGQVSQGVSVAGGSATSVDTTGWTGSAWCFALTNPAGATGTFRFSAQKGLEAGTCTSSTVP